MFIPTHRRSGADSGSQWIEDFLEEIESRTSTSNDAYAFIDEFEFPPLEEVEYALRDSNQYAEDEIRAEIEALSRLDEYGG